MILKPAVGHALIFSILVFMFSACSHDDGPSTQDTAEDSIEEFELDGDDTTGIQPLCATLDNMAGGYSWIHTINTGDDPSLCRYIDCELSSVNWNGALYIDSSGLFRMAVRYTNSYTSSRIIVHVCGVAHMTDCDTMVLENVYDYSDNCRTLSRHVGPGWYDPVEIDTIHNPMTLGMVLLSNGMISMTHPLDLAGGEFPWEPDSDINAYTVDTEYDDEFSTVQCDPFSAEPCACTCEPNGTACVDSWHVAVCDAEGHATVYDCDTSCELGGYGTPQGCEERDGVELCWCDLEPCYEEPGTRECLNDIWVRICGSDGYWYPKHCDEDCADYGYGPAIDCRWIPEQGIYDCWCESA